MKQLLRDLIYLIWQAWHMVTCDECELEEVAERYGI